MPTIENCKIKSTSLGVEDLGIFTAFVWLEGDGWGCGFGGFAFDQWNKDQGRRVGNAFGVEFIRGVLETLEVDTWEKLPGTFLRAECDGVGGGVRKIGHPIKNVWFDPKQLAAEIKARA